MGNKFSDNKHLIRSQHFEYGYVEKNESKFTKIKNYIKKKFSFSNRKHNEYEINSHINGEIIDFTI